MAVMVATPHIKQAIMSAGVPSPGSLTRGCLLKEKASTPDAFFKGFPLIAGVIKLAFLL